REVCDSTLISNHFNYETKISDNENICDYQQALAYSDTLLRLYKKNQEPRHIANAQLIRARINNKLGNYKESSQEYASYILSKDSLNTVDLQKQVIAMQASKEVADAQLAEGIVKQRLAENQNITLWVFVIGLLIIGSLLAFLLTYYMKNQFRLKEYNAQLKVALSRAEEGVRVKENFMHHISHEIRTPLNSIIGFCSILDEMYPKDEQMHQYLRVINENGQKLVDVITGILNVSDLQNTMLDEPFTKEDISKLVADIIDKYRSRASVKTKISYQSSLPENFKLPIRLESLSMLLNGLISNAVKYTESGTITIINGLDDAKEYLVLSIEDTGIGINEDDADSIFDLFFKENKYELGGGTGLFVSQQVAEGHRGSLLYDKDYKEGARFVLKLPLEIA
ncbi:MAG: HAMP domain-containing sensor histidine kinase, partial [Bacteroidaceae bacterium]